MNPISALMAQAIKSVLATFSAILPLVLLPFCFTWAGGMMGSLYKWSRGLGEATRGIRQGFAVGVGTSRLGDWAAENVRENGFWRRTRAVLANTVVSTVDVATLTALDRRVAVNRTMQEADLARFQARRGSRMPLMGRLPGSVGEYARAGAAARRAASLKLRDTQTSEDLGYAQVLLKSDVLDGYGIAPSTLLSGYADALRNGMGSGGSGPYTIQGSKEKLDLTKLNELQRYGLASLAAENGDVNALAALRVYSNDKHFQAGLNRAMATHADKIRSNGGGFLLRPELRDEKQAQHVTANSFGISLKTAEFARDYIATAKRGPVTAAQARVISDARAAGSAATPDQKELVAVADRGELTPTVEAALAANGARLRDIVDYHMINAAYTTAPEKVAALAKDHQEALANVVTRAAAVDNYLTTEAIKAHNAGKSSAATTSQLNQWTAIEKDVTAGTASKWQQDMYIDVMAEAMKANNAGVLMATLPQLTQWGAVEKEVLSGTPSKWQQDLYVDVMGDAIKAHIAGKRAATAAELAQWTAAEHEVLHGKPSQAQQSLYDYVTSSAPSPAPAAFPAPPAPDKKLYHMIYARVGKEDPVTHLTGAAQYTKAIETAFGDKELAAKMPHAEVSNRFLKAFARFA